MQRTSTAGRIEVLDYLRGFFIFIIIVDHLYRWPNLFAYISGRGELWVSAAEGFVIISGLLVGYVRGRKNFEKPFAEISKKLVSRGIMLYIWSAITTILLVAISWTLTFRSPIAYVPYSPFDWYPLLRDTLTLTFSHSLTHFLYLYAIFLVLAPIIIWLLRRRLWWIGVIASIGLYIYGFFAKIEWMQWQILFYLPAITGFYLDDAIAAARKIPTYVIWIVALIGVATILWSAAIALPFAPGTYHPPFFGREPLEPARVALSFLWFGTVGWLFTKSLPFIKRFLGWLLLPFGTRSLTAYILHAVPLMILVWLLPPIDSIFINTLLTIVAVLATWALINIPGINKVIPR